MLFGDLKSSTKVVWCWALGSGRAVRSVCRVPFAGYRSPRGHRPQLNDLRSTPCHNQSSFRNLSATPSGNRTRQKPHRRKPLSFPNPKPGDEVHEVPSFQRRRGQKARFWGQPANPPPTSSRASHGAAAPTVAKPLPTGPKTPAARRVVLRAGLGESRFEEERKWWSKTNWDRNCLSFLAPRSACLESYAWLPVSASILPV